LYLDLNLTDLGILDDMPHALAMKIESCSRNQPVSVSVRVKVTFLARSIAAAASSSLAAL
jgi:hypothetical protein